MKKLKPMGFAWVGLYAHDLPKLSSFYEHQIGLSLIESSETCCIFDAGAGALFEIWSKGHDVGRRKTPREQSMVVGFLVSDLEAAVAQLKERGVQSDTAIDAYLGTRWIYFTDPEGNRFELKDVLPADAQEAQEAQQLASKASLTMGARPMARHEGSCHCGAVRFAIETDFPELTMCDCSICRRKNALMVKVHESKFTLLAGEDSLTTYQFHSMTALHYFCKACGIYPFHRKRVTPDHLGINVFCLDDFDPTGIPVRQAVGAAMP